MTFFIYLNNSTKPSPEASGKAPARVAHARVKIKKK